MYTDYCPSILVCVYQSGEQANSKCIFGYTCKGESIGIHGCALRGRLHHWTVINACSRVTNLWLSAACYPHQCCSIWIPQQQQMYPRLAASIYSICCVRGVLVGLRWEVGWWALGVEVPCHMMPMRAFPMTGRLIDMGRVNVGAVHQHLICSNPFACELLKVGATSPCCLILTDTRLDSSSQLLFLLPAVLGLCCVTLPCLQQADHVVAERTPRGWVQTEMC